MQYELTDVMFQYPYNNQAVWSQCWDNYFQPPNASSQYSSPPMFPQPQIHLQDVFDGELSDSNELNNPLSVPPMAFRKVISSEFKKPIFVCTVPNCGKSFTRRAENAIAHYLLHKQISPFHCDHCSSAFRRASDLKRHVRNLH
jgi:hypothetical protein